MVAEFCAVRPENTKSAVRSSGDGCRLGVPIEPVPGSHFKSSTYDTHRLALGLTRKPIVTGSVRDSGRVSTLFPRIEPSPLLVLMSCVFRW